MTASSDLHRRATLDLEAARGPTGLSQDGSTVAGLDWKFFGVVDDLFGVTDSADESAATYSRI